MVSNVKRPTYKLLGAELIALSSMLALFACEGVCDLSLSLKFRLLDKRIGLVTPHVMTNVLDLDVVLRNICMNTGTDGRLVTSTCEGIDR
jgi:hypothetical protein